MKIRIKKLTVAKLKTIIFAITLVILTAISLVLPLRPTKSNIEKRTLTKFPEFSLQAIQNGQYFEQIGTWYADTFPMREDLISYNAQIKSLYGIKTTQMIGSVRQKANAQTTTPAKTKVKASHDKVTKRRGVDEQLDNIYISGDSAYSLYGFNQSACETYAQTVSDLSKRLGSQVQIYDVVVPTSSEIYLDKRTIKELGGHNEKQAINYIYKHLSKNIEAVDAYRAIDDHSKEYLYFRTDHHWTARGAYYAYQALMEKMGKKPSKLSDYKRRSFKGFLGTSYAYSNQAPVLKKHPDIVHTYQPKATNKMKYLDREGNFQDGKIIADARPYDEASKYMAFIAGDEPFEEIHNPKLHDNSSCVVIKESFGNAFVPFLVNNFENVYVVDYRYYEGTIPNLVQAKGIRDVIFLNNISAASTDSLIAGMQEVSQ